MSTTPPKKTPNKRKVERGRVTEKGATQTSSRYTAPTSAKQHAPSPMWVPILMFALFGLGVVTIFVNYTAILWDTRNAMTLVGLGMILGGLITATQYR